MGEPHGPRADQQKALPGMATTISCRSPALCRRVVAQGLAVVLVLGGAVFGAPAVRAADPPGDLAVHDTPRSIAPLEFRDGSGRRVTLSDFRGKVILLNLWATWCPPCREEMPTLDELQRRLGGENFEVVALSLDRQGKEPIREFYSNNGIDNLRLYISSSTGVMSKLRGRGLATTLIVDRRGREVARKVGEKDWSTPQMVAYLRDLIEREGTGSASTRNRTGDPSVPDDAGS